MTCSFSRNFLSNIRTKENSEVYGYLSVAEKDEKITSSWKRC